MTLDTRYSRQRLHQKLGKVARAKHEVRLERPEMIEEYKLVEENLEQALRGDRVRVVDRSLQAGEVAILECCGASVALLALDWRVWFTHLGPHWPTSPGSQSSRYPGSCNE